tara:strand:+ start:10067 stop:10339 length:273 start_codon:yes stop_codon:yes gene_type:complete
MSELETYQKLNLLNSYLADLKCKGRPPKWYKNLVEYLEEIHDNIPFSCLMGEPIYCHVETINDFINYADAGQVNELYYAAGFSPYGQFVG